MHLKSDSELSFRVENLSFTIKLMKNACLQLALPCSHSVFNHEKSSNFKSYKAKSYTEKENKDNVCLL